MRRARDDRAERGELSTMREGSLSTLRSLRKRARSVASRTAIASSSGERIVSSSALLIPAASAATAAFFPSTMATHGSSGLAACAMAMALVSVLVQTCTAIVSAVAAMSTIRAAMSPFAVNTRAINCRPPPPKHSVSATVTGSTPPNQRSGTIDSGAVRIECGQGLRARGRALEPRVDSRRPPAAPMWAMRSKVVGAR